MKNKNITHAKKNLKQFIKKIDIELENYFDQELKSPFGVSRKERALTKHIWEHIKEHNLRPAKRLRGSFVYFGYKLLGGKGEKDILNAAMSIELVHTALLMHDDMMDQDDTRRGLPTTHEHYRQGHDLHYGESMAVDVGDIALLAGHQILSKSNFNTSLILKAQNRMLRGIINTGFGQAFDITLEAEGKATEQDIYDLHLAKTAIYTYENPLHIGAILAGATEKDLKLISKYAIPGGVSFQLQDDILGLFGDPERTGKPAHSDLRQGKMTLLAVKVFELAKTHHKAKFTKIWGNKNLTESDANTARKIVTSSGSLEYSKKVSLKWAKKARNAIPLMTKQGWNKESINYLDGVAQYMVERDA